MWQEEEKFFTISFSSTMIYSNIQAKLSCLDNM